MEILDRLIEILCAERGENVPFLEEEKKPLYFRALCNVREPMAVSDEFIKLQDEYLSALALKRGIVDISRFAYCNGIALYKGDITRLNSDAIVNACNSALLGCFQPLHNCIDNCIHSFAGVQVRLDCNNIMQGRLEPNGSAKVTKAYNLPSKFIFHTVGPMVNGEVTDTDEKELKSCYLSCLNTAKANGLKSIAFCCISTGLYGFNKSSACRIAVQTVKNWQAENGNELKIIFNVFTDEDKEIYERELGF